MQAESVLEPIIAEDLAPIAVDVTGPGGKKYILKEATQQVAKDYQNVQMRATRFGPNGRPIGTEGSADAVAVLVAGCLFEVYESGGNTKERPVLLSTINSWKPSFVRKLFERARKISGLNDEMDEASLVTQIELLQEQLDQVRAKSKSDAVQSNGKHEGGLPN